MKAIGYVRVSTEEQAAGGVSLAAQYEAITAYCSMRGFDLVRVVKDPGVSAGKPLADRPGGARLVKHLKRGHQVVALKLDRLFRDCADCLTTATTWERRDIALHLLDLGGQAVDTSTAMGRFFLTVMAGAAEMERNLVRERTRTAMQHKKRQGQRVGQIPYGKKLGAGDQLVDDQHEQHVIRRIRRWRKDGASIRLIARMLNDNDIKPRGKKWHATTVARILNAA